MFLCSGSGEIVVKLLQHVCFGCTFSWIRKNKSGRKSVSLKISLHLYNVGCVLAFVKCGMPTLILYGITV